MELKETPQSPEDEHDHKDVQTDLDIDHGNPPMAHAIAGKTPCQFPLWHGVTFIVYYLAILLRFQKRGTRTVFTGPWQGQHQAVLSCLCRIAVPRQCPQARYFRRGFTGAGR